MKIILLLCSCFFIMGATWTSKPGSNNVIGSITFTATIIATASVEANIDDKGYLVYTETTSGSPNAFTRKGRVPLEFAHMVEFSFIEIPLPENMPEFMIAKIPEPRRTAFRKQIFFRQVLARVARRLKLQRLVSMLSNINYGS